MNLTEKMIHFHKNADVSIFNVKKEHSITECWGVCIELFAWLKLEHKRYLWKNEGKPTCSKPLKLDPQAAFTAVIPDFVENDDVFKHTLKINGDKLYYSEEITEEEIRTITKQAYEYYNPERHYN